jgi:hypothetical protein
MPLCAACKTIRIQQLPDPSETGFQHSTAGSLLVSAKTCPLCALMKASFLKVDALVRPPDFVERDLSSYCDLPIRLYACRKDASRTPEGGANVISIELRIEEKTFRGRFDVYAAPGELSFSRRFQIHLLTPCRQSCQNLWGCL